VLITSGCWIILLNNNPNSERQGEWIIVEFIYQTLLFPFPFSISLLNQLILHPTVTQLNSTQPEAMRPSFPIRQPGLRDSFDQQQGDLAELRDDRLRRRLFYRARNGLGNSSFASLNLQPEDLVKLLDDRYDRGLVHDPRDNLRNRPFPALNQPIRDEETEKQRPPTIIVRFIHQGGLNPRHFDLPIHVASIPTNLNSVPDEIRDALKVRYPSWRSGFSLQSVVVKWKNMPSETDLIRLNRAQRETAFKRMEENKWLDMVEIKYKRN
jgi:hypothetical protein